LGYRDDVFGFPFFARMDAQLADMASAIEA
jgi:hypothetical protein